LVLSAAKPNGPPRIVLAIAPGHLHAIRPPGKGNAFVLGFAALSANLLVRRLKAGGLRIPYRGL